MKKEAKFLAVIPARSGSKGIPGKNIRLFCGKPLISYAIKEAKKCNRFDRIIVSTDSREYAKIAERCGAEVPFLRPKELADDKSPIVDTILHLLLRLEREERYVPDYVVILQATSPLRTYRDIAKCMALALENRGDAVASVCSSDPYLFTIKNGFVESLTDRRWLSKTNRQQLPSAYRINGAAVLVTRRDFIFKRHSLWGGGKIVPYFMEKWRSIDINSEEDFQLAELVYSNRHRLRSMRD